MESWKYRAWYRYVIHQMQQFLLPTLYLLLISTVQVGTIPVVIYFCPLPNYVGTYKKVGTGPVR